MVTLKLPFERKKDALKGNYDITPMNQYGDETLKNIVLNTLKKDKTDRLTAK